MYNQGDLVSLKTTGEEACVLTSTFVPTNTTGNTINTTEILKLRIPRMTRDGIVHYDLDVYAFEVESKLDSFKREIESLKQRNEYLQEAKVATAGEAPVKVN